MSSSRPGGSGLTWWARSSSSSVVSPIAETTTTTSLPALRVATIRSATRLMRSASATEEPPYFCTTSATASSSLSTAYAAMPAQRSRPPAPVMPDAAVCVPAIRHDRGGREYDRAITSRPAVTAVAVSVSARRSRVVTGAAAGRLRRGSAVPDAAARRRRPGPTDAARPAAARSPARPRWPRTSGTSPRTPLVDAGQRGRPDGAGHRRHRRHWRVDVPGGALGGSAPTSPSPAPARGRSTSARQPGRAAALGSASPVAARIGPAAIDPRVQHVFTDWLDVLTDRPPPLAVAAGRSRSTGVARPCFAVESSAASLVAPRGRRRLLLRRRRHPDRRPVGFGTLMLTSRRRRRRSRSSCPVRWCGAPLATVPAAAVPRPSTAAGTTLTVAASGLASPPAGPELGPRWRYAERVMWQALLLRRRDEARLGRHLVAGLTRAPRLPAAPAGSLSGSPDSIRHMTMEHSQTMSEVSDPIARQRPSRMPYQRYRPTSRAVPGRPARPAVADPADRARRRAGARSTCATATRR